MKNLKSVLVAAIMMTSMSMFAQLKTPQPSPSAEIEQTVGLSTIKVNYSRPGMKDRKVFGELVEYGKVWRTGANKATAVEFSQDVTIGGKALEAGAYALFTIPGETEWTIIFNKNLEQWGAGEYKQEEDAIRFTVKAAQLNDAVETFTINFSHLHANGANMNITWENTLISFEIEADSKSLVEKQIKSMLIDGPSAGTYYGAARYYLENDNELEQALTWINIAIEKRPNAFWYIHRKAKIEAALGNTKDAIKTAEKSLELAKASKDGDYGYTKMNEELIKKWNSKK